ncbi:MAG: hypothetical protein RBS40_13480 [Rhodocyclaceae bacterium]|jgi:hypothetical protein|nr:hypothetical protein [Rhodocyclaceae bacterium]
MLMDFASYTAAQLQAAQALLADAQAAGLDLSSLRALIEDRVRALVPVSGPSDRRSSAGPGPSGSTCPSCGRGVLAPVANREGLRILGCRLCRYSRLDGGHHA